MPNTLPGLEPYTGDRSELVGARVVSLDSNTFIGFGTGTVVRYHEREDSGWVLDIRSDGNGTIYYFTKHKAIAVIEATKVCPECDLKVLLGTDYICKVCRGTLEIQDFPEITKYIAIAEKDLERFVDFAKAQGAEDDKLEMKAAQFLGVDTDQMALELRVLVKRLHEKVVND